MQGLKKSHRNLPHWELGGSVYFITFNSVHNNLTAEALKIVLDTIKHDHRRKYRLYIALAMPDHVHLIIQPLQINETEYYTTAEIMKSIKGVSARRINDMLGSKGTVWQAESFDRIIRNEQEFLEKWNYITNNPLKSGLVDEAEKYEFVIVPNS